MAQWVLYVAAYFLILIMFPQKTYLLECLLLGICPPSWFSLVNKNANSQQLGRREEGRVEVSLAWDHKEGEEGEPPSFRGVSRRGELPWQMKNMQEGGEMPCKRAKKTWPRGLLIWVKSSQKETQELVSSNSEISAAKGILTAWRVGSCSAVVLLKSS